MPKNGKQKTLSYFTAHTKGIKRFFILSLAASFISIFFSFLTPQIIRVTVDSVIGEAQFDLPFFIMRIIEGIGGREVLRTNLAFLALAVVFCTAVEGIFNLISRLTISHGTETYMKRLRDTIFRHIQHLPFSWHTKNRTGDIIQRCTSDMDIIRQFIAAQLLEVIRITTQIAVALYLMSQMNGKLTLIAAAFIPVVALYSGYFYPRIATLFRDGDEAEGDLMVSVQENLTGVRVVRAFGREQFELKRFDEYNETLYNKWVNMGYKLGAYWGMGDFVTGLQILTIIVCGAYFAYYNQLTLGEFIVFVSYTRTLAYPLRRLGRILSDMSKMRVSGERLAEIMREPAESDPEDALTPEIKGKIIFENVSFSYDNAEILHDLCFEIEAGTTFGILGATGSGKSTLSYLIDRLYDLDEGCGRILIDDIDIKRIEKKHLRRNVGAVLQEPFLFSKTIADNIAIASPNADISAIRNAAAIADVDESISQFPSRYETLVGERGVTLSGGQKQRVAIARTLMSASPIMIFDDSLSAVDLTTDAKIRAALKDSTGDATIILISHRINTLMESDKILVLDDGRVSEIGTHDELMNRDGIYKRTYDMQSSSWKSGRQEGDA